jgi:hypothetical protein
VVERELGYRGTQVLSYIRATFASEGEAPSYAMIRDELGIAHSGHVCRIVKALEARGLLARTGKGKVKRRGQCRRIVLVANGN